MNAGDAASAAYTGDVTALCSARLPPPAAGGAAVDLLLAGIGSQLHVYALPCGQLRCCTAVLPDVARVHGIAWLPEPPGTAPARPRLLLATHGGRHGALVRLLGPEDGDGAWQVQHLARLPRFQDWTMDVQLSWAEGGGSAGNSSAACVHLAVGLSSNAVEAFAVALPAGGKQACVRRVLRAEGGERCLLYSMALLPLRQCCSPNADSNPSSPGSGSGDGAAYWLVAGGTVYLDVVVWATPLAAGPSRVVAATSVGGGGGIVAPTLFRLKGHEGSVHKVRWAPQGGLLASASDDRSLRLWSIPPAAPAMARGQASIAASSGELDGAGGPLLLQARRVLWGHKARLWDCAFGGDEGPAAFLVTASEDCSCRVWCLATGQPLCTVRGHRGRGIWQCALLQPAQQQLGGSADAAAAACCLFTGGADSSIKCWRLADWLPLPPRLGHGSSGGSNGAAAAGATGTLPAAAECFMLQGLPQDPATAAAGSSTDLAAGLRQAARPALRLPGGHSDSRTEAVRCLAIARDRGGGGGDPAQGHQRQRWLYVGTNLGLLHRVHLPDAATGNAERWVCLLAGGSQAGKAMPLVSLALLPAAAEAGGGGRAGCSGTWIAACHFGGLATVLLDRPAPGSAAAAREASQAEAGTTSGSSGGGPAWRCSWQPYGSIPSYAGLWWGSPSCPSAGTDGSACGLGSSCCFTAHRGLLTCWLLPRPWDHWQQPERLAEVRLPFDAHVSALAAARLPQQPGASPQRQLAAIVAVGDIDGGITLLLLLAPPLKHASGPPAGQAESPAGARLLVLAGARRVCELTPVRTLQVQPPNEAAGTAGGGAGAHLTQQLAATEVRVAGGDATIRTLRIPQAAAATAALQAAATCPAAPQATCAAAEAGPASAEAGRVPAALASLPRLLCSRSRRFDAVTHIDGAAGDSGVVHGFHSDHFAVWDEAAEAAVAQVACGGHRRPSAADVAAADDLVLCFAKQHRLWLYRRRPWPAGSLGAPPPRCLHPPHHGLEQECIQLLAWPGPGDGVCPSDGSTPAAPAAAVCLTGGGDGLLRQQLLALPRGGGDGSRAADLGGGAFSAAAQLAETAQGTAIKRLALLQLPGRDGLARRREWLLLAAGAKQALMACRLRHSQGDGAGQQQALLSCDVVAARELPPRPPRKTANRGLKLESDQRYLSICAFFWHPQQQQPCSQEQLWAAAPGEPPACQCVFVVAAASDASLALLCADLAASGRQLGGGRRGSAWREAAVLRCHAYPVLCTAHCLLGAPQDGGADGGAGRCRHIVCSGATDGSVAVWDLSAAAAAAAAPAGGGLGACGGGQEPAVDVRPLVCLEGVHQSGVNTLAVAVAGAERLLLLTGGDDQALCLTLLQLVPSVHGAGAASCSVLLSLPVPCAHSSAVRSVWLGQLAGGTATAFSLGLDQQVRSWRLHWERRRGDERAPRRAEGGAGGAGLQLWASGSLEAANGQHLPTGAAEDRLGMPWLPSNTAEYTTAGLGGDGLRVAEAGCRFTQVIEPVALDVLAAAAAAGCPGAAPSSSGQRYLVGVAGRGTELMEWRLSPATPEILS